MIPDSSAHCSRDTRAQREFDRRLTERKTPFDEVVRLAPREKEYTTLYVLCSKYYLHTSRKQHFSVLSRPPTQRAFGISQGALEWKSAKSRFSRHR